MSIIISILIGLVAGWMIGAAWQIEKREKLAKENSRLREELEYGHDLLRYRKRKPSHVSL